MSVTYFVALPFIDSEEGPQPGEAVECQSPGQAKARAEALSRKPEFAGAVAFQRSGDPALGDFSDAEVLARYGITPDDLAVL
jgi:hypothetical protein